MLKNDDKKQPTKSQRQLKHEIDIDEKWYYDIDHENWQH